MTPQELRALAESLKGTLACALDTAYNMGRMRDLLVGLCEEVAGMKEQPPQNKKDFGEEYGEPGDR